MKPVITFIYKKTLITPEGYERLIFSRAPCGTRKIQLISIRTNEVNNNQSLLFLIGTVIGPKAWILTIFMEAKCTVTIHRISCSRKKRGNTKQVSKNGLSWCKLAVSFWLKNIRIYRWIIFLLLVPCNTFNIKKLSWKKMSWKIVFLFTVKVVRNSDPILPNKDAFMTFWLLCWTILSLQSIPSWIEWTSLDDATIDKSLTELAAFHNYLLLKFNRKNLIVIPFHVVQHSNFFGYKVDLVFSASCEAQYSFWCWVYSNWITSHGRKGLQIYS